MAEEFIVPSHQQKPIKLAPARSPRKAKPAKPKQLRLPRRLTTPGTLDHVFSLSGGRDAALALTKLAGHEDPDMAKLADLWSALSVNEPEKLEEPMVIERLCAEAGLHPSDFLGRLTATAYKHNFDVASYLAAINGAEIVKQRIKQALQPEGFKDAELILKHTNFVREEKGTEINITNQQLNVAKGLPSFQDVVNDVTSIARAEPPAQLPPAIDVPAVVLPQDNSQPAERSRD